MLYSLPEGITRYHISLPSATGYCMVANKNARSSASMDTPCMQDRLQYYCNICTSSGFFLIPGDMHNPWPSEKGRGWLGQRLLYVYLESHLLPAGTLATVFLLLLFQSLRRILTSGHHLDSQHFAPHLPVPRHDQTFQSL